MKTHILTILVVLIYGFQIYAQDAYSDFEWIIIRQANSTSLTQQGDNNHMVSIQEMNGILGNQILTDQSGSSNTGYIKQVGELHFTKLMQNGIGNEANIWQKGQKVAGEISQKGSNNFINSYVDNQLFLPKVTKLEQIGISNSIEIALTGNGCWSNSWPLAALIEQNGNNHSISAKLESFSSPVLINQQSGPTGEGMKINISNSAFYFPMK